MQPRLFIEDSLAAGLRAASPQTLCDVLALSSGPSRGLMPSQAGAAVASRLRLGPCSPSIETWFWPPKAGMARSTGGMVPSACGLALGSLIVRRASRSFRRSFAGLGFHVAGIRPARRLSFSAFVVSLLRRSEQAGTDDLPRHGDVAGLAQHGVEAFGQPSDRAGPGLPVPEQPDRARGARSESPGPRKRPARQRVVDQELAALVRQVVRCLDHQHVRHHHRVVGRPPRAPLV